MITSLLFAFYIWLFWFWTPLKSRFWPCSFRPTLKKIGPIENFHFFVFYESTYSTLRKCKKWTCVFLINIYFASRWGVPSKEDPPRKDRPSTIVTFAWQTQPWYAQLLTMSVQPPFLPSQFKNLLTYLLKKLSNISARVQWTSWLM